MLTTGRANGFALIEVLIAVFILGVGLLGVAGLQSSALRLDQGAYLRSQATVLAGAIADRMRANPNAVEDGHYDLGGASTPSSVSACEQAVGCSTQQMAQHDLNEWITAVQNRMPQGAATVCIDSSPDDGTPGGPACDGTGDSYAIKIWWYWRQEEATNRFVTEFQP